MISENVLRTAEKFVSDDARQRVRKIVTGLREQRLNLTWSLDCPKYGVVDTEREVPRFTRGNVLDQFVAFNVFWKGKFHWLDLPLSGLDTVWSGFQMPFCTYKHTALLSYAVWCEYSRDPYGPQVPAGHSLGTIGNKQRAHESLLGEGIHCEMSFFQPNGKEMSIARQYSNSFITSFALPGQDPVYFNEIDAQVALLNRLATESGPSEQFTGRGNSEDAVFLSKLKAKCYAIKKSEGPFAAKYAFEIYKDVARYIDSGDAEEIA